MEAALPHLETTSRVIFPGCPGYEKVACALKDWRDAISALEGEEVDLIQQVKEHEAVLLEGQVFLVFFSFMYFSRRVC